MKRLVPVLLLAIILLNFFGVLPVFHLLQQNIRSEVKTRIKSGVAESELHKITFAKNERIDWVKEGKEFRKDGDMYDVVRRSKSEGRRAKNEQQVDDGTVTYYCVNDFEEKMLFENLNQLCHNQEKGIPLGKTANDFVKTFSQTILSQFTFVYINSETYFEYKLSLFALRSSTFPPPTPPPNC